MISLKRTIQVALLSAVSAFGVQAHADAPPGYDSWDQVLEEARGQTVYWYMWGGSDAINGFVLDEHCSDYEPVYK